MSHITLVSNKTDFDKDSGASEYFHTEFKKRIYLSEEWLQVDPPIVINK
jgi:hypothetical protein